ncbi:MAG: hypothetical protein AAGJ35_08305 [Myxococcota bacterium]
MMTREQLKSAIDQVDSQHFETLYRIIQSLQQPSEPPTPLMQKLQTIKVNAPKDFARNIDQYLYEEKNA